ncbi:hypothetical protein JCM10212_002404 [Sporobolomyces blumeae]
MASHSMLRSVSASATETTTPPSVTIALRSTAFRSLTTRRDLATTYRAFKAAWTAIEQVQALSVSCRRLAERAAEVLNGARQALESIEDEEKVKAAGKVVLERSYEFKGGASSAREDSTAGKTIFKIQATMLDLQAFAVDHLAKSTQSRLVVLVDDFSKTTSALAKLSAALRSCIAVYSLSLDVAIAEWATEDAANLAKDELALPRLFQLSIVLKGPVYDRFVRDRTDPPPPASETPGQRRAAFIEWCLGQNPALRPRADSSTEAAPASRLAARSNWPPPKPIGLGLGLPSSLSPVAPSNASPAGDGAGGSAMRRAVTQPAPWTFAPTAPVTKAAATSESVEPSDLTTMARRVSPGRTSTETDVGRAADPSETLVGREIPRLVATSSAGSVPHDPTPDDVEISKGGSPPTLTSHVPERSDSTTSSFAMTVTSSMGSALFDPVSSRVDPEEEKEAEKEAETVGEAEVEPRGRVEPEKEIAQEKKAGVEDETRAGGSEESRMLDDRKVEQEAVVDEIEKDDAVEPVDEAGNDSIVDLGVDRDNDAADDVESGGTDADARRAELYEASDSTLAAEESDRVAVPEAPKSPTVSDGEGRSEATSSDQTPERAEDNARRMVDPIFDSDESPSSALETAALPVVKPGPPTLLSPVTRELDGNPKVAKQTSLLPSPILLVSPTEDVFEVRAPSPPPKPSRPFRILSLDGGRLVGPVPQLLALKRHLDESGASPYPCHDFDLVVGTSSSALPAILLGHFGRSVDEALEISIKVSRAALGLEGPRQRGQNATFVETSKRGGRWSRLFGLGGSSRTAGSRQTGPSRQQALGAAVEQFVISLSDPVPTSLGRCRTAVLAFRRQTSPNTRPEEAWLTPGCDFSLAEIVQASMALSTSVESPWTASPASLNPSTSALSYAKASLATDESSIELVSVSMGYALSSLSSEPKRAGRSRSDAIRQAKEIGAGNAATAEALKVRFQRDSGFKMVRLEAGFDGSRLGEFDEADLVEHFKRYGAGGTIPPASSQSTSRGPPSSPSSLAPPPSPSPSFSSPPRKRGSRLNFFARRSASSHDIASSSRPLDPYATAPATPSRPLASLASTPSSPSSLHAPFERPLRSSNSMGDLVGSTRDRGRGLYSLREDHLRVGGSVESLVA